MDEISNDRKITYDAVKAGAGTSKRFYDIEASSSKRLASGSSLMTHSWANRRRSMNILREDIHGDFSGRKRVMRTAEIEEINKYLRGLEKESYLMKQAFLEAIKERKKLIHEVYRQLEGIDGSLLMRSQLAAESSFYASSDAFAFEDLEDRRTGTGLSQVLCQLTNALVLSKNYRTNVTNAATPRTRLSNNSSWS